MARRPALVIDRAGIVRHKSTSQLLAPRHVEQALQTLRNLPTPA